MEEPKCKKCGATLIPHYKQVKRNPKTEPYVDTMFKTILVGYSCPNNCAIEADPEKYNKLETKYMEDYTKKRDTRFPHC